MTLSEKDYLGLNLDYIARDDDLFTVGLARVTMTAAEFAGPIGHAGARLIFLSPKRIVLSNVGCDSKLCEIKQSDNGPDEVHYIFKFLPESSIEVTARGIAEIVLPGTVTPTG